MPELPEVETVRRGLAKMLLARPTVVKDIFWSGKNLRRPLVTDDALSPSLIKNRRKGAVGDGVAIERAFRRHWRGRVITALDRRAKYMVVHGDKDGACRYLLCHLGMSGFFRFLPAPLAHKPTTAFMPMAAAPLMADNTVGGVQTHGANRATAAPLPITTADDFARLRAMMADEKKLKKFMRQQHLHLLFYLQQDNGGAALLAFYDPRRFGFVADVAPAALHAHPALATLGVEPFSADLSIDYLWRALQRHRLSLKTFLLNQKIIVGIGNIYASEILWLAALSPQRPCHQLVRAEAEALHGAIRTVLTAAIEQGGSSFSDFRHVDGQLGYFAHQWQAYDRAGQPCQRCHGHGLGHGLGVAPATMVKIIQSGRASYYCPQHQI